MIPQEAELPKQMVKGKRPAGSSRTASHRARSIETERSRRSRVKRTRTSNTGDRSIEHGNPRALTQSRKDTARFERRRKELERSIACGFGQIDPKQFRHRRNRNSHKFSMQRRSGQADAGNSRPLVSQYGRSQGHKSGLVRVDNSCEKTPSFTHIYHSNDKPKHIEVMRNHEKVQSEPPPPPIKVPRAQRRGLFGRFAIVAEVTEPKDYARSTKYLITVVIALAALAAPLGSTIILPSLLEISHAFRTSAAITNLAAALYMLAIAIFPLWWSSFSEVFGRRSIYIVSFTLFFIWNIFAVISVNMPMFLVMRILGGGAAASVDAVGAGTIADVWEVHERGRAMGLFYLGPLMGPLLAPIIGGALAQTMNWRSTLWFLVVYGGVMIVLIILTLPETLKPSDSTDPGLDYNKPLPEVPSSEIIVCPNCNEPMELQISRSTLTPDPETQATQNPTSALVFRTTRYLLDPLKIILYLRYPAVSITVYYASIAFGALYLLNISLETSFSGPPYSFNTIIIGLTYIPSSIGYILAAISGGHWTDRIMAREARRAERYDGEGKLAYRPEDRMRENVWIAAIVYPCALIWYGWAVEKELHWAVPLVANVLFGWGSMLIFGIATTMLTEFMPRKASEGVAVNNFVRYIFSCVGALLAAPLISAIGNGWLFTGVGGITLLSSVVVWVIRRYSPRWKERMVRELG